MYQEITMTKAISKRERIKGIQKTNAMKTYLYILATVVLLINTKTVSAQCRSHIQDQGNNNAFDVTLTFNDENNGALQTCFCTIAGNSGNLNCPKECGYTVPGKDYMTITFSDGSGNNCLYDNNGNLIMPLAIELLSFTANFNNSEVQLKWQTASETNNDYFTVEKTKDMVTFETVTILKTNGNSNAIKNYSFIDTKPYNGLSYYRLKQTDNDGKSTYSDFRIVSINKNVDFTFNVFPNPTNNENLNMIIKSNKGQEIMLIIIDVSGRKVYSSLVTPTDSDEINIDIASQIKLSSGMYMVSATSQETVKSKVIVIR